MTDPHIATAKLLLDQGVPRDAAALLRESGFSCVHVSEIDMQRAPDRDILQWAAARGFVVVTLDADFHSLLAASGASAPSVVRLRVQGANARVVLRLLDSVLTRFATELSDGCMVTVKAKKTTCHRLPVG